MRSLLLVGCLLGCTGGSAAPDASGLDGTSVSDAGPSGDAVVGEDAAPPIDAPPGPTSSDAGPNPALLSMQGVYGDFAARSIPSDAITYTPRWELWSDGAKKRRWILLPPGGQIDNTDPEHWTFPVGTRLVKEFARDGVLVETRIVETTASGTQLRTYVWNAAQTEATTMVDGAQNVAGTQHDVPTLEECTKCHRSEAGGALGVAAVQLGASTLAIWSAANLFVVPLSSTTFGPTGTATEVAALGYLHANCGHCHNPSGYAAGTNNMSLRLAAQPMPATSEPGFTSTVNVTVQGNGAGAGVRIAPGNPTGSAVIRRMSVRGNYDQMPLVGSELVDADGVSTVTAWVSSIGS